MNVRPRTIFFAILLAALVPAGCGSDATGSGNGNTIRMRDDTFSPANLTVSTGTTVRWVNEGSVQHNTVSSTQLWTSANLNPGGSFERRFDTAGSFPYVCTLHVGMAGTVTVQ
jgi:plastocyanin